MGSTHRKRRREQRVGSTELVGGGSALTSRSMPGSGCAVCLLGKLRLEISIWQWMVYLAYTMTNCALLDISVCMVQSQKRK